MAFIEDEDQQKDKNSPDAQNQVPAGQGSGLVLPNSGSQPGGATPQQPNQPTSSGSYTNLQKYLDVNQDQAQPLAQQVGSGVAKTAADARSSADQGVQQFTQQVQSQVPQVDQDLVKGLQPAEYKPGQGINQQVFSPVSPVGTLVTQPASYLTQPQVDSIKTARTATYQGPNSIEDTGLLQDAYSKAQQANDLASQLNTEQGRFTALQKYMNQDPSYGQGQQLLDQAILEAHPESRQTFQDLSTNVAGLNDEIGQRATAADQIVDPAKQQIDMQKTSLQTQLQSALDQYMKNLNLEEGDYATQRTGDYNNLLGMVNNYQSGKTTGMTPAQINQAYQTIYGQVQPKGVVPGLNDPLSEFKGINLANYIKQGAAPTLNSISTQGDLAEVQALQDLAGDDRTLLNANQVGGYLPGATQFNKAGLESDLTAKLNSYLNASPFIKNLPNYSLGNAGNRDPLDAFISQAQADNKLRAQYGMPAIDLSSILNVNQPDWSSQNTKQEAAMGQVLNNLLSMKQSGNLDPNWIKSYFDQVTPQNSYAYQPPPSPPGAVTPTAQGPVPSAVLQPGQHYDMNGNIVDTNGNIVTLNHNSGSFRRLL